MTKIKTNMTEGPFLKKMLLFAIPLMLTGVLQCTYSAADLVIVGKFRGDLALAAVGSTGPITNLIIGFFLGLSVGAGVLVANYVGARKEKNISEVVHTSVLVSLVLGVLISTLGFIFSRPLLTMMDTPEEVLPHAFVYIRIIFLGIPAMITNNYMAAMMRSSGDSRHPLIFFSVSSVINVILNAILICFFGLGVDGVAIATVISEYLTLVLFFIYFARDEGALHLDFRKLKIYKHELARMLYIGIPAGIQSILGGLSGVVVQAAINSFGESFTAGSTAAESIESFIHIGISVFGQVALTFVGQNVGARKYKNIKPAMLCCTALVTVTGLFLSAVFILLRYQLLGFYVSSDAAMEAGLVRYMTLIPVYFISGWVGVFAGALRALGKSLTAMLISLGGGCCLRILWMKTIFVKIYTAPSSIFVSSVVCWIVTSVLLFVFFVIEARKLMREDRLLSA